MWICSKCNEEVENAFDYCPKCGAEKEDATPKAAIVIQDEQTPMEFIQAVRKRTCYSALRGLVDGWFLISFIATIIVGGVYLFSAISAGSTTTSIIAVVAIIGGCVLTFAVRQSSLLLIDIADTLIEQNRKKKNKEVSSKH